MEEINVIKLFLIKMATADFKNVFTMFLARLLNHNEEEYLVHAQYNAPCLLINWD